MKRGRSGVFEGFWAKSGADSGLRGNRRRRDADKPRLIGKKSAAIWNIPRLHGKKPRLIGNNPRYGGNIPRQIRNKPRYGGNKPRWDGNMPQQFRNKPRYGGNQPRYGRKIIMFIHYLQTLQQVVSDRHYLCLAKGMIFLQKKNLLEP